MTTLRAISPKKQTSSQRFPNSSGTAAASLCAQVTLFLASGGLATFIHWTSMVLLVWGGLTPVLATIIGAFVGSIFNYWLQFYWTFKGNGIHGMAIPAYICTVFLGWCVNAVLFYILTSFAHMGLVLAQLSATAAVAVMNFIAYKKVVFHERFS
ncbi:TPA: GtrA family protein [Pseudomonas aeruginosa]|nr:MULTISPECIES: GtrA family protein [Alcaligenaceae]QCS62038.1 GtrA family protein [Achromobacter denitrificans]TFL08013.1 GtrA family protein [Pusillimonas caeni]